MADLEENLKKLEAQLKDLKTKKAPAAETKPLNDQIVALRKSIGQAKKAAKPAEEGDDEAPASKPAPKAADAKEAEKKPAAKTTPAKGKAEPAAEVKAAEPAKDTPKAEAPKQETPKDAPKAEAAAKPEAAKSAKKAQEKKPEGAKSGAKDAPKTETPKTETPKTEAPKAAEAPKDAPKTELTVPKDGAKERKKSEKETPAKGERKKSEKEPAKDKQEAKTEGPVVVHAPAAKKLRLVGVSGSLRKESYNTALLKFVQKSLPADVEMVIADISRLPLFNQDTEYEPHPEVKSFKETIESADAVFFCTPEYNYSFPGVLKNAIDVASRPWGSNSWAHKPTGLLSASVAWSGGIRAQYALRQCFIFLNLIPYPGQEVMVGTADKVFDKSGEITDQDVQKRVREYVDGFVKFIHRYQAGAKAVP